MLTRSSSVPFAALAAVSACAAAVACAAPAARAQTYTYASQFGADGSGDGQFGQVGRVAVQSTTGNVFVADLDNTRVQYFNPSGTYLGQISNQGHDAFSVAFSPDSTSLYVGSLFSNLLTKYNAATGAVDTTFGVNGTTLGGPGNGTSHFGGVDGIAVQTGTGNVYVADYGGRIQYFTANGVYLGQFNSAGSPGGTLFQPQSLVFDTMLGSATLGDLFVLTNNNQVQIFTPNGSYVNSFTTPIYSGAQIAFTPQNNLLISSNGDPSLFEYSPSGTFLDSFATGDGSSVYGLAINQTTNTAYATTGNHRVQIFSSSAPEPGSIVLILTGGVSFAGVASVRRRRSRRNTSQAKNAA